MDANLLNRVVVCKRLLRKLADCLTMPGSISEPGYAMAVAVVELAQESNMTPKNTTFEMLRGVFEGIWGGPIADMVCNSDYCFHGINVAGERFLQGFMVYLRHADRN